MKHIMKYTMLYITFVGLNILFRNPMKESSSSLFSICVTECVSFITLDDVVVFSLIVWIVSFVEVALLLIEGVSLSF